MGNKIITMVTTFVTLIAFIILVAFISTDSQIDESKQLIREFTETVRYKGYITYDQYNDLLNKIPYKNVKVQITHFVNDLYSTETYSPGTLNMRFTSQILGTPDSSDSTHSDGKLRGYKIRTTDGRDIYSGTLLYNGNDPDTDRGIYKMQVGDQIQVDLIVMERTFFDAIVGTLTGSGTPSMKILTSSSGVILNEKYNDKE